MQHFKHPALATLLLVSLGLVSSNAQDVISAASDTTISMFYEAPAVKVLGEKPRLMSDLPGSATYLSPKTIREIQPNTSSEVLRTVPGVIITEEEGVGMRLNVGIRGLDPDRSSRVLVLEDGIPVALNPFGEPQLYYSPVIDRMESIEVLKGSGQILFGPQTVGGVINYITADPPAQEAGRVRLIGGENGYFSGLISYGNTLGNAGFKVDYLRKQGDRIGATNFRINDLSAKINLKISPKSALGFKFGVYDELSNSTYIGLTQSMYEAGDQDFVQMAPDDRLTVRRLSLSAIHEYRFNLNTKLKTSAFGYTTTRNWQRQDFGSAPASNATGVVWGDTSIPGGAVYMRNSNGHRNRQFEVAGVESRLMHRFTLGSIVNRLEAGARFLHERAYEQRVNGKKADARSGTLVSDEIRSGQAVSAFAQNKFEVGEKLAITIGLRSETYFYERHILRNAEKDTSILSNTTINQVLPGAGINYNLSEQWSLFAGVHRGFAPPRVLDAIANNGVVYNLDPELSWNTEIGFRNQVGAHWAMEFTAFNMSFSNQIIPISESSGGSGTGFVNGGSTLHQGLELGLRYDLGQQILPAGHRLEWSLNGTYVNAYYDEDRFVGEGDSKVNIRENRTPYAPEWWLSAGIAYEAPKGLSLRFTGNYIGEQFTDELNTVAPSANGQTGQLPAYFVMDASAQYQFPGGKLALTAAVKNLTDERYISTRRPQGIRVGLPRMITAGLDWKF